ncbi:MAG: GAF domain-containing protein [Deltaproteobacteria bacterium]|jgi:signal transduction protein with GAF and PtsI domain|nr:GAF domain-containing protein [Deltaproteobacteria bacterium]
MNNSLHEKILGIICSVFDAYTAVLFLNDNPGRGQAVFSLDAVFSLGNKVNSEARLQPGQGLAGWIASNRAPLLVPNFDQRRSNLGYYLDNEEQNIKAFMSCPFPGGGGVICVDSKRQYSFSERDQKLLFLFAEFLDNLCLSGEQEESQAEALRYYAALRLIYVLRREHSRWDEFLHGFLDIVSKAAGFEYCALFTKQPDGENYGVEGENYPLLIKNDASKLYNLNRGMVGWVFRNSSPLFNGGDSGVPEAPLLGRSEDAPAFQSLMALPLIIQRKVRGVLCLASKSPLPIGADVQDFARMASEHLALFLENLYVKCRLRDLHKSMTESENKKIVS